MSDIPELSLKFGDLCRAKCGAPARYVRAGICLYVSSMMGVDLCPDEACPARGDEKDRVLPSDDGLQGFSVGYTRGRWAYAKEIEAKKA